MFWWPNSEVLKISNFGHGRWLEQNDHLFRPWLQEKHYYFCKDFSYGHDLHINRMRKWLFWRANSENLKIQYFGRGRSVGQKDHYFRLYMTQKTNNSVGASTVVAFYEVREWWIDCLDSRIVKFYQTQNSGCGRLLF